MYPVSPAGLKAAKIATQEGRGGPVGLCLPTQGTQVRSHPAVRIHMLWKQLSLVPQPLSVESQSSATDSPHGRKQGWIDQRIKCTSKAYVSSSSRPCGPWPTRLLCPWGFSRQDYWGELPCPPPIKPETYTQFNYMCFIR